MTTQEIEKIIKEYKNGESMNNCGKIMNCSPKKIKEVLTQNGIRIRSRAEQTRLSNMKRKKSVNDTYFDNIDTVNKAWILGFIASDGTVRKDVNAMKIGLSSIDREILEKIREEISIERQIIDYQTGNGFNVSELSWTSAQQKKALAKYGIVNNKTYLPMHLPNFENDNLKLAFILGYHDGDGSISIDKTGKYLRMRFCSYRDEILKDFQKFFEEKYFAKTSLCKDRTRQMYELSISTTFSKQIYKDMYSLNSLKLDRKYQKYLEYISQETTTS
jgi:intein-encoded DNA endonuclease-like protein